MVQVYVKVLVVAAVLCSCFVQEAWSAKTPPVVPAAAAGGQTSKKAPPATVMHAAGKPRVAAPATGKPKAAPAKPRATTAVDPRRAGPKPSTTKRAVAPPPPPPPSKWPNLATVRAMFWYAAEALNKEAPHGKMVVRAARNAMAAVLTGPAFWSAAGTVAGKIDKTTRDRRRAAYHVRACDAFTGAFTDPRSAGLFQRHAGDVYDAAASVDAAPYAASLSRVGGMVDRGVVTDALDGALRWIRDARLDPNSVVRAFGVLKKSLNWLSAINMTDSRADHVTRLGTMMVGRQQQQYS